MDEPNITTDVVTTDVVTTDVVTTEPVWTLLDEVKLSLRLTTSAYDNQLTGLMNAALLDLGIAGVVTTDTDDALIRRAIITYCMINFGSPADFDRLKRSYDEQKAQLSTATGYTSWG